MAQAFLVTVPLPLIGMFRFVQWISTFHQSLVNDNLAWSTFTKLCQGGQCQFLSAMCCHWTQNLSMGVQVNEPRNPQAVLKSIDGSLKSERFVHPSLLGAGRKQMKRYGFGYAAKRT